MGTADRAIRVVAALVLIGLYAGGVVSGPVAIILAILGAVFLATSAVGVCPLYMPFGIRTRKDA